MLNTAVAGLSVAKLQAAWPPLSAAVSPATTPGEPRKLTAAVVWAVFCSATSVVSCEFMAICCSTCANCTSCWVNWLVSSGSSGFWFLSCVVSSVRNVSKFCEIVFSPIAAVVAEAMGLVGLETVAEVMVMGNSLHADVETGAEAEPAAVGCAGERLDLVRDHHAAATRRVVVVLLAASGLVAQREFQALLAGLEPGILQRALERRRIAAHGVERFRARHHEARRDAAVAVDAQVQVDTSEFGRIEADLEAVLAAARLRDDLHGESGDRHWCLAGSGVGRIDRRRGGGDGRRRAGGGRPGARRRRPGGGGGGGGGRGRGRRAGLGTARGGARGRRPAARAARPS